MIRTPSAPMPRELAAILVGHIVANSDLQVYGPGLSPSSLATIGPQRLYLMDCRGILDPTDRAGRVVYELTMVDSVVFLNPPAYREHYDTLADRARGISRPEAGSFDLADPSSLDRLTEFLTVKAKEDEPLWYWSWWVAGAIGLVAILCVGLVVFRSL